MRLAPLLATTPDDELRRLAVEHACADTNIARPQLCNFLETAILNYRFIQQFILNRQPPTFAILALLLDSPGFELPVQGFGERVMDETKRIANLLDFGELLSRDGGLRLYRAALCET